MHPLFLPVDDPIEPSARQAGLVITLAHADSPTLDGWATGSWLTSDARLLLPFLAIPRFTGARLLALEPARGELRAALGATFSDIVPAGVIWTRSRKTLLAVLAAPDAANRALAVVGSPEFGGVVWRGDFSSVLVPAAMFPPTPQGLHPDFTQVAVIDAGYAIALGEYEAAADVLWSQEEIA